LIAPADAGFFPNLNFALQSYIFCKVKMTTDTRQGKTMVAPSAQQRLESRVARQQQPWSSRRWCSYFEQRRTVQLAIPWERGAELTPAERDLVASSLQVFQQGEAQEGGHFYRCATAYAAGSGDGAYAEAHRLFMEEEKRHGRDLGRFLTLAGVPVLAEKSWLTRAFCWCGSRGGLEPTLLVILMSELIALLYYAALRSATRSVVLRRLCTQILRDEKQHVRFQAERLALMRCGRRTPMLTLHHTLDGLLFVGALLACWCGHRRVLRAAGLGFLRFCRAGWRTYRTAARQKDPRTWKLSKRPSAARRSRWLS
jgi:hypothetical protein